MKTLTVAALACSLLASTACLAAAQAGRHFPAEQVSQPIPDEVVGGSGSVVFEHRAGQADEGVWVKIENTGDCVIGVVKQRLRVHLRGRDRFLVQPGATVYAAYEKEDFDLTLHCAEPKVLGGDCDGSVTLIPVRRGAPDDSMGRLASLEIYSGSPMAEGATCGDPPVDLPILHVKHGRTRLDAEVVNAGSGRSGCTTFELISNGSTLVADHAGAGGSTGGMRLGAVEDAALQARCTGGGDGCAGTLRITLTPRTPSWQD